MPIWGNPSLSHLRNTFDSSGFGRSVRDSDITELLENSKVEVFRRGSKKVFILELETIDIGKI